MKKKQLSILIPVYNETCYDYVKKLAAMCEAMEDAERLTDYEIIVADDASTSEDCLTANRPINDIPHCRLMEKVQNTGSAATRNYLAQQSTFDWLLFLDSDMEISDNDFLLHYLECEAEGVINGGISIGAGSITNLRYLYEKHCEAEHTAEIRRERPYHSFRSTNFLIQRDIMLRCPFDERFKKSGYEDVMFGKQLMSEESGAAADAIGALAMMERVQIPDSLFDAVSGYIRFARRYHARYLIQWLWVMVMNDKLTEADYECCLKVLEDVGHLVGRNYETDDDQASDIIYESFVLAGMIYAKREEQRDNPVILSWKAMAEDEEVFNDQRMGWGKGEFIV